jgi:membrane protein DedA with SNARE-associated domain
MDGLILCERGPSSAEFAPYVIESLTTLRAFAGCFALTAVSAVVPWVNAEIVLLSFTATASSPAAMAVLVVVATAGQMTGKLVLFAAGRQGSRAPSPRVARLLDVWRPRWMANPSRADRR